MGEKKRVMALSQVLDFLPWIHLLIRSQGRPSVEMRSGAAAGNRGSANSS